MKLYLTSYRIPTPQDLEDLLEKKFQQTKVAVIANAKDYLAERARSVKVKDCVDDLKSLGFRRINEVDLRDYDDRKKLKQELQKYDLVWVTGGNTFCLMHEITRSGFSQIIKELLGKGIVYGGESAGAVAAGNSLRGVEFEDNPDFSESIIWDGMKLIDKYVLPHADNQLFAEAIEKSLEIQKANPTLIKLKDSEALVVKEGTINLAVSNE